LLLPPNLARGARRCAQRRSAPTQSITFEDKQTKTCGDVKDLFSDYGQRGQLKGTLLPGEDGRAFGAESYQACTEDDQWQNDQKGSAGNDEADGKRSQTTYLAHRAAVGKGLTTTYITNRASEINWGGNSAVLCAKATAANI
jgi:hypothetical protein